MDIGKFLENKRIEKSMNKSDLAKLVNVSSMTIGRWENNELDNIKRSNISALAKVLDFNPALLFEYDSIKQPKGIKIPVLGTVAAGIPISAIEDILDYEEIPASWESQGEFFALRISGNSMQPKFDIGDVVIVKQQNTANNGDIVIVLVNGDDATCKRFERTETGIMLISTNPNYTPIFYTNEEIESLPVTIIGKVVELRAKF